MERYITLTDGTGMNDELIIFQTNTPAEILKELEQLSCDLCKAGKIEEVPIWGDIIEEKGYTFKYINSHQHITPYGTSETWLKSHTIGSKITEHYIIENQFSI